MSDKLHEMSEDEVMMYFTLLF